MNLHRILAAMTLVIIVCSLIAGPIALAGAVGVDEEVWCLSQGSRKQVVNTAETLGLGKPAGSGRALIVPRGSSEKLSVSEWQLARPQDFSDACEQAYEVFGGGGAPDEESPVVKVGIAAGAGAVVAGVGGLISYAAAKKGRKDERGFQVSLGRSKRLIDELAAVNEAVDQLAQRKKEGTDDTAESQKARGCATRLESTIRSSGLDGDVAIKSLTNLTKEIDAANEGSDKQNGLRIELAGAKVETAVQALITGLGT